MSGAENSEAIPTTKIYDNSGRDYVSFHNGKIDEESVQLKPTKTSNAIIVLNATKSYRKSQVILKDLCMTVPTGIIYGLLGPSGCGKTTLLQCILSRLSLNSGSIETLGHHYPCAVPSSLVGFMPQDLALCMDLTILESLHLHGRLQNLTKKKVQSRIIFLSELLSLPVNNFLLSKLSGGQQRRTSFAVALLHEPKLIILDEPTVGVDPQLRAKIWQHLFDLSSRCGTTILLTTHYTEEARNAHKVGLLRGGSLLAEDSPDQLLQSHNADTLEKVFLQLCQVEFNSQEMNQDPQEHCCKKFNSGYFCSRLPVRPKVVNIGALIIKNLTVMRRNLWFLCFQFIVPTIQMIMFCMCIGREPHHLPLAIVNNDTAGANTSSSEIFLQSLDSNIFVTRMLPSLGEALLSVKRGENLGVILFLERFTESLEYRLSLPGSLDNETLSQSTIHTWLDASNYQVSLTIQQEVVEAFNQFIRKMLPLNLDTNVFASPIKFHTPVYGKMPPNDSAFTFTDFMAPGVLLSIIFFMATGLTALSQVSERKNGVIERFSCAGVTSAELMLSHIFTQILVMTVQVFLLLVFTFLVFKVPNDGLLILVILLTASQGITGMSVGLLISVICHQETSAVQCALCTVYPNLLLSGVVWPIEGMPLILQTLVRFLPMTYASEAMRSILLRGWDLSFWLIRAGFLTSWLWTMFLLILTLLIMLFKQP